MGALPSSEPFAFRFAPYIKELREFLASSRLHYGAPEDIFPVTERLQNSRTFAEDMSSMIRSILLREGGSMAHAQLLEILAISIGGPEMEEAPQAFRQPLRQLLSFLTGVLRRPWNIPPGEEAEPPAPAPVATYSSSSDTFDHPEVVNFPSGPSGPFAAAAALSAAEPRQAAAKPPARELIPPVPSATPELDRAPIDAETQVATTTLRQPSDPVPTEPEYGEREFAEYEALETTSVEELEAARTGTALSSTQTAPSETQPVLEAPTAELPTLAEPETFKPEALEPEPLQPEPLEPETAEAELVEAQPAAQQPRFEPSPAPAFAEPPIKPEPQVDSKPQIESEPVAALADTTPEISPDPIALPAAAPGPSPTPAAETAVASEVAAAPDPEPTAVSEPHPVSDPALEEPVPVGARPMPPAPMPLAAVATWPRHHTPGLSSWRDSPFDDSFPEIEALPVEPVVHARPAAAPWISPADDIPANPPWMSASTRNVLIAGAAAIVVAVLVAVALRPTGEGAEPIATASSPAPVSAANSSATSLTPQSAPTSAAVAPAKPTPYGDPFTPQQNPNRPPRTRSADDDEYTGSDVAPPTYRSFVTPSAPAANAPSQSAPQSSANSGQPSNANYSIPQSAPVERRSPGTSLVSEPVRQSFRNPDATLAGDSRPVRPSASSRSLSGSPTFRVSSGVMAANLISAPNPDYPTFARLTHTQGEVIIQAVISRDGHVSATHVLSGHRLLRGAAVDAVKRWRYRPYVADGRPVDVATIIRVGFRAHN